MSNLPMNSSFGTPVRVHYTNSHENLVCTDKIIGLLH